MLPVLNWIDFGKDLILIHLDAIIKTLNVVFSIIS